MNTKFTIAYIKSCFPCCHSNEYYNRVNGQKTMARIVAWDLHFMFHVANSLPTLYNITNVDLRNLSIISYYVILFHIMKYSWKVYFLNQVNRNQSKNHINNHLMQFVLVYKLLIHFIICKVLRNIFLTISKPINLQNLCFLGMHIPFISIIR